MVKKGISSFVNESYYKLIVIEQKFYNKKSFMGATSKILRKIDNGTQ